MLLCSPSVCNILSALMPACASELHVHICLPIAIIRKVKYAHVQLRTGKYTGVLCVSVYGHRLSAWAIVVIAVGGFVVLAAAALLCCCCCCKKVLCCCL